MGLFGSFFRDKSRDEEFCRFCESESAGNIKAALSSWGFANAQDSEGKSALIHAVENNREKGVIDVLIDGGADKGVCFHGLTPLMTAVKSENIEAIKSLVERKASLQAKDWEGHTALYYALSDRFNPEIFDILRKGGVKGERNNKGQTLLMEFAGMEADNVNIIDFLIKAGADVNASNSESTVLMSAIDSGKPEKIIAVLEAGVDVNKKLPDDTTALFYVSGLKTENAANIVKLLLAHGADVNAFKKGEYALDHAIKAGNTEIAGLLRAAGGIRNFAQLCISGTFDEVLTELKTGRVNVNATWPDGTTPLMFALENDDVDVFKLLIEAGANINACKKFMFKGMCTVLDIAKMTQVMPFGKMSQRVGILRSYGARSLHPEIWK
ncbi:MAG: ankyrin repeat domain-containing protein [Synergistaceae bacterium]|nr:ankyrin repeat domain-containing protein [Synergistaceae bacterium]